MYVFYADEFGHDGVFDPADPNRRHHPLFGLAGFALRSHVWRDFDRRYLRLKQRFFPREILREGARAERFEPKELDLRSRRDKQFTHAVFDLLRDLNAVVFAYGIKKPIAAVHNSTAIYGSVTQGLMRACEKFVRNRGGVQTKALMVIDRRQEARDVEVLASAQSYLFSAAGDIARGFERLIEVPMLVRSEWHHGIQVADNICRVVGRAFRFRVDPANEAKWQGFDTEFGAEIDALTHQIARAGRSRSHKTADGDRTKRRIAITDFGGWRSHKTAHRDHFSGDVLLGSLALAAYRAAWRQRDSQCSTYERS